MHRIVVAGLIALASSTAHAVPRPEIAYEVHRVDGANDAFAITLTFRGEASGRSRIVVPSNWASAQHAERGIQALAVTTSGARLESTDDPKLRLIVHRPGALLTVRYVLRQIEPGDPSATAATPYLPVIRPGYFEWIGWTAWVVPYADRATRHVVVRFSDLPGDWSFASSFGLDPKQVTFDGPIDRFQSSLFLGGDFRLRSRTVRGAVVITAMRGGLGDAGQ